MVDYSIVIQKAEIPVVGGPLGFFHIRLELLDQNGNLLDQINGLETTPAGVPTDPSILGRIGGSIGITSSDYDVVWDEPNPAIGGLPVLTFQSTDGTVDTNDHALSNKLKIYKSQTYVLSEDDALARWTAALQAGQAINTRMVNYTLVPNTDTTFNSNSIARTLLRVMGLPYLSNFVQGGTPGSTNDLLPNWPAAFSPLNGNVQKTDVAPTFSFANSAANSLPVELNNTYISNLYSVNKNYTLQISNSSSDIQNAVISPSTSTAALLKLPAFINKIALGSTDGNSEIDGISTSNGLLMVGLRSGNTLIAGNSSNVLYAPNGSNTFYGNPNLPPLSPASSNLPLTALGLSSTSSGTSPTISPTWDVEIAASLDQGTSSGSNTFYSNNGDNIMIGGQGTNTFNVDPVLPANLA